MNIKEISVESIRFCGIDLGSEKETDTVEVIAESNGIEHTFYVQLVDGKHRADLGCWLLAENSDGDINQDDYPDFDLRLIVETGEKYYKEYVKEIPTDYNFKSEKVYLVDDSYSIYVVTKNPQFINSTTSSYQRIYSDPIASFDTKDEAVQYLSQEYS